MNNKTNRRNELKAIKAAAIVPTIVVGIVARVVAAESGLVAHFTFDDATQFGYDKIQDAVIGTISVTNYSSPASSAMPTSCDAPMVRGMIFPTGWFQSCAMTVPGASFGSSKGIPYGNFERDEYADAFLVEYDIKEM